jgi:protein-S-isoprenylcysteine O-methyltransferase Ste14
MRLSTSPLLLACWLVFWTVWAVTAQRAKPSRRRARFHPARVLRFLFFVAALFLVKFTDPSLFRVTVGAVAALGCAVCAAGTAFAVWARLSLGENWGMPMTVREHPELVTRGPYALVRHPIYTGVTVALIGTALVVPAYWALVAAVSLYFAFGARREEKDMLAEFPEKYAAYRRRTKWFVPFLF